QYNRGIEGDRTSNRQGDASPGCRRGPPQCAYTGVCGLFSGLDERDDEKCWDVGCGLDALAVAAKVGKFPSSDPETDARGRNGELPRGQGVSSYLAARIRMASFLERLSQKVMADRITERHQEAVIEARMAQNANRMQTDRAGEQRIFTKPAGPVDDPGRCRSRRRASGAAEPVAGRRRPHEETAQRAETRAQYC